MSTKIFLRFLMNHKMYLPYDNVIALFPSSPKKKRKDSTVHNNPLCEPSTFLYCFLLKKIWYVFAFWEYKCLNCTLLGLK